MKPADLKVEAYPPRSESAGGQHVGTGPVGIKVTHLPTGIVAVCQHMRSQHYNRAVCLSGIERMLAEAGWQPQASAEEDLGGMTGAELAGGES